MDGLDELLALRPDAQPGIGHNQPPLEEQLAEESEALRDRRDQLLRAIERVPETVEDEETCGKVADMVRLISACIKAADAARVARKEPFLASGRLVDAAYKRVIDPLEKGKKAIEARLTAYQRAKAEAERRRREDEARRQAEEAARQRREAEEAAAKAATDRELDQAISAEEMARQAEADAAEANRAAVAKAAEMSRSRGDYGAVASLRTVWKGEIKDRQALDLEPLRPFLPADGLERALNAFVRAGGRQLRGASIYEHTTTTVR